MDFPGGEGPGDKIVENNVETHARGDAVGSSRSQIHRAEAVSGEARYVTLGLDFRSSVLGNWIERAGFVNHLLASEPVIAAGRGKYEAPDTGVPGKFCNSHTCTMIDIICQT